MCCGQSRWLSWFSAPTITINTLVHVYNITKHKYYKYYKIQILHMDKYYTRTKPMIELIFRLVNYWYHGILLLNQPLTWWWRMRAMKSIHQFLIEPNNGYDGHFCHWGLESLYIDGAWRCIDDNGSSGFDEHADSVDDFHFHPANVIEMISADLMIPRAVLFSWMGRAANHRKAFDDNDCDDFDEFDDFHGWV